MNADYSRITSNYTTTTNRLYSQARYERIIQDTDWTLFEGATGEYDHFRSDERRLQPHHVELYDDDQPSVFASPLRTHHSRHRLDAVRRSDRRIRPFQIG